MTDSDKYKKSKITVKVKNNDVIAKHKSLFEKIIPALEKHNNVFYPIVIDDSIVGDIDCDNIVSESSILKLAVSCDMITDNGIKYMLGLKFSKSICYEYRRKEYLPGYTLLEFAIRAERSFEIIKQIVDKCIELNYINFTNALFRAVYQENFEVFSYLVKRGADYFQRGRAGQTIVQQIVSCISDVTQIQKYFSIIEIDQFIDYSKSDTASHPLNSLLRIACHEVFPENVYKYLQKIGFSVPSRGIPGALKLALEAVSNIPKWLFVSLLENEANINSQAISETEETVLMKAAEIASPEVFYDMLAAGADPLLTDIHGADALYYACQSDCDNRLEIIECLIKLGCNTEYLDTKGRNLILANLSGRCSIDSISFLERRGVDIFHEDHEGRSAIEYSLFCKNGSRLLVSFFLKKGFHFYHKNKNDVPAIFEALQHCSLEDFHSYLNYTDKLECFDSDGNSLLMVILKRDYIAIAKNLLQLGWTIDPFYSNKYGKSILTYSLDSVDAVELLINHGVDFNIPDNEGNYFIHVNPRLAIKSIFLLKEHGIDFSVCDKAGNSIVNRLMDYCRLIFFPNQKFSKRRWARFFKAFKEGLNTLINSGDITFDNRALDSLISYTSKYELPDEFHDFVSSKIK